MPPTTIQNWWSEFPKHWPPPFRSRRSRPSWEPKILANSDSPPERRIRGEVTLTEALGSEIMVHASVDATPALTEDVRELAEDVGDDRAVQQIEEQAAPGATLVGRFGARSRVKADDVIEIAVDTRALHFFDVDTGLGIYDGTTKGADR